MGEGVWNVKLVSQLTLHLMLLKLYFPNPSQPSRSRAEQSWWLLDTAALKPFHQRTDMFKRFRFRQHSPWAWAHMGSRCHGSLTGGSPVMRESFTLRWSIQAVYKKDLVWTVSTHTHSHIPSAWFTLCEPNTRAPKQSMGRALEVISDLDKGCRWSGLIAQIHASHG